MSRVFPFVLACVCVCLLAGCVTEQVSRIVVGSHFALPTISSVSDEVDIKVFESVDGAIVQTRKNSIVTTEYKYTSKSSILNMYEDDSQVTLTVTVNPCSEQIENTENTEE